MSKVLRASKAGFPCDRNLWYSLNSTEGETDEATQRIFDVGTYLEPLVVEWLKRDGWEVTYNPGSQSAELEIVIPLAGGELRGHPDCVISRGSMRNVLMDIKTMNERAFRLWRRDGTLKSKPQYVDQVHIYAQGLRAAGYEIEHLGIVGVNKNNSEMHIDIFDFDPARMAKIQERGDKLTTAENAPVEDSPREAWCCNYCEYASLCELHQQAKPNVEELAEGTEYTESEDVIDALRDLQAARDMAKEARDLEAHAKEALDDHMKAVGKRRISGGGYLLNLVERERVSFDSTAFKKEHPELSSKYMKKATSIVYELKALTGSEME